MAQLVPLPLTVSCFSEVQIGFTFLLPAHPGSPGQRAVKRAHVCVSVCVCVCVCLLTQVDLHSGCKTVLFMGFAYYCSIIRLVVGNS